MYDSEKMFELADRLKELRDTKKELEQQLKSINTELDEVDFSLATAMLESETQNFTRSGVMLWVTRYPLSERHCLQR
jgi:chromosome segregation ATPase